MKNKKFSDSKEPTRKPPSRTDRIAALKELALAARSRGGLFSQSMKRKMAESGKADALAASAVGLALRTEGAVYLTRAELVALIAAATGKRKRLLKTALTFKDFGLRNDSGPHASD
jgi:hypothetical protein